MIHDMNQVITDHVAKAVESLAMGDSVNHIVGHSLDLQQGMPYTFVLISIPSATIGQFIQGIACAANPQDLQSYEFVDGAVRQCLENLRTERSNQMSLVTSEVQSSTGDRKLIL